MGADDRKKCTNEVEILKVNLFWEVGSIALIVYTFPASFLQSLRHPNIIQYFEHFFSNNELHIIMEYAEGGAIFSSVHVSLFIVVTFLDRRSETHD